ncbi:MAG TPA: PEP-utilizing enzyme [Actinomycetota bacterium]|jgi:pyruvate,water dikinase|nr:PEP-utilizing enzyme [Actinomycetota bacterium]
MALWPQDTEPDEEFPLYTRGNVGEVFPTAVTPLTRSLMTPRMERGWRRLWTRDLPILDPTDHEFRIIGFFGAHAYLNLSLIRRAADLAPGTSPEEIDHQFFAIGIELPSYEQPNEPGYEERRKRVAAGVESLLQNPPRASVQADREMAFAIRRIANTNRAQLSDVALLTDMDNMADRAEMLFYDHILTSSMSSVAFGGLQQGLRQALGERGDDLARRAVSGLGDVDSAGPATMIAELAQLEGGDYRLRFNDFLTEYGFRGANEWELAAPSWEIVPDVVREQIASARGAAPKQHPADVRAEAVAEIERTLGGSWPELGFWLEAAKFFVPARERTKTNCIVLFNEARLDAHLLAQRLVERGLLARTDQVFMLTFEELQRATLNDELPLDLADRTTRFDDLRSRTAPLVVFGEIPPLEDWTPMAAAPPPPAAVEELRGVAGSPGEARGRVRVVLDPYRGTPPAVGEILVAPITDPGWTPLFIPAVGVVVEVGGELSHAVIVARELGIPAVVAAAGACSALHDGDLVEMDGSAGVVRVLERAG